MTFQILWKAYPLIMVSLSVLAIIRFRFIQNGQTNTVLGMLAIALFAALLQYGHIECAIISSIAIVLTVMYRSMKLAHLIKD